MPDSGLASSNSSEAPNAISGPESAVVAGNSPLSYKNAYSSTLGRGIFNGRGILNEFARVDGLDRAARLPRIACLPLIAFMDDPSTIRILAVLGLAIRHVWCTVRPAVVLRESTIIEIGHVVL